MPSRRSIIELVGTSITAGGIAVLAPVGESGFRLGAVWITNDTTESLELSFTLMRDGEDVYDEILDIRAKSLRKLDLMWAAEPATYTLTYGRPDHEPKTIELTGGDDISPSGDCMFFT